MSRTKVAIRFPDGECLRCGEMKRRHRCLPRVDIIGCPFPLEILFFKSSIQSMTGYTHYVLKVVAEVHDTRSHKLGYFGRKVDFFVPMRNRVTPLKVAKLAREALHSWLMHEADEWLHVNRKRVFDPHRDRRRGVFR